ncbi:MAG: hypothetical protein ACKO40_14220 [Planctomycetaceae bacterium]
MTAPSLRVRGRLAGLVAPAAVILAAAVALARGPAGPEHRRAVAFAATVCLTGTIGACVAGLWPASTPSGRVTTALAAICLRLFPALLGLGWLQGGGSDLRAANAGEYLVVFYLVSLAADLVRIIMGGVRGAIPPP